MLVPITWCHSSVDMPFLAMRYYMRENNYYSTINCSMWSSTDIWCVILLAPPQITQLKIEYNPFAKGFRGCELAGPRR